MYEETTPVTRPLNIDADELAAALSVRQELGPQAEAAAIATFLERTGHAIDARVDQRVAQHATARGWGGRSGGGGTGHPSQGARLALAIVTLVLGIPLSGIAASQPPGVAVVVLVVVWTALAAINIAFSRSGH